MAKIYIVNGSPRKKWNTAQMCESFSKGAKDGGAETEIINLYDVDFKGCRSCFACKLKNGKNYGRCAYPDGLTSLLDEISQADGLVVATPIYLCDITGVTKCFLERLAFPFMEYKKGLPSVAPKKLKTATIYTMNVTEDVCSQMYSGVLDNCDNWLTVAFSKPQRICAYDTYQYTDYDRYVVEVFDKNHKKQHHDEQFSKDLEAAYQAGLKMAKDLN